MDDPDLQKALYRRGVARIGLAALSTEGEAHRPLQRSNVTRLKNIFKSVGCQRLNPDNFVSAVIGNEELRAALVRSNLEEADLCQNKDGSLPLLHVDKVDCLHGFHRVEAAQRFLFGADRWWSVILFSNDIQPYASRDLTESYSNSLPYSDGDIFWKIRHYHMAADSRSERQWLSRLSKGKQRDLGKLLGDRAVADSFDALLDLPSLWRPIQLGSLRRLLELKFREEILNYLARVRQVWTHIIGNLPSSIVDEDTVKLLQALAPSRTDVDLLKSLMNLRKIFPALADEAARASLLQNIRGVDGLIPSLFTFFEDLKLLEPCSRVLKKLFQVKGRHSIFEQARLRYHTVGPSITTDDSDNDAAAPTASFELAYVELFVFILKYFPELTRVYPLLEDKEPKDLEKYRNPRVESKFREMAISLGFLAAGEPHPSLAVTDLIKTQEFLNDMGVKDDNLARQIRDRVHNRRKLYKTIYAEVDNPGVHLQYEAQDRRYGLPLTKSHEIDKSSLGLMTLRETRDSNTEVTSVFVKLNFLSSFLGKAAVDAALDAADGLVVVQSSRQMLRPDSGPKQVPLSPRPQAQSQAASPLPSPALLSPYPMPRPPLEEGGSNDSATHREVEELRHQIKRLDSSNGQLTARNTELTAANQLLENLVNQEREQNEKIVTENKELGSRRLELSKRLEQERINSRDIIKAQDLELNKANQLLKSKEKQEHEDREKLLAENRELSSSGKELMLRLKQQEAESNSAVAALQDTIGQHMGEIEKLNSDISHVDDALMRVQQERDAVTSLAHQLQTTKSGYETEAQAFLSQTTERYQLMESLLAEQDRQLKLSQDFISAGMRYLKQLEATSQARDKGEIDLPRENTDEIRIIVLYTSGSGAIFSIPAHEDPDSEEAAMIYHCFKMARKQMMRITLRRGHRDWVEYEGSEPHDFWRALMKTRECTFHEASLEPGRRPIKQSPHIRNPNRRLIAASGDRREQPPRANKVARQQQRRDKKINIIETRKRLPAAGRTTSDAGQSAESEMDVDDNSVPFEDVVDIDAARQSDSDVEL